MDHSILDGLGVELAHRTRAPQGLDQVQVHRRTVAGRTPLDGSLDTGPLDTDPLDTPLWGVSSHDRLRDLTRLPLVVAPMAGGPTTPVLVLAAADAGALGMLAAGYKTAAEMQAEIAAVRSATSAAFGVNVFVPGEAAPDPEALAAYVGTLEKDAGALGVAPGAPRWDDDDYGAKLDVLLAAPPPLVSFTFGCPARHVVRTLQAAGSLVAVTVTTPAEAVLAQRLDVDCLCVQGLEAGAHRGTFVNDDRPGQDHPLSSLLAAVRRRCDLPLIAAGGIADREGVAAALAAGATQVQLGRRSCGAPRAAPIPSTRRHWPIPASPRPPLPAPSAAAVPAVW